MFTMGPVHARDHDPGCFIAGVWNQPQDLYEVGLILCPFRNVIRGSKPALSSDTWRPSADSKVLVAQHD